MLTYETKLTIRYHLVHHRHGVGHRVNGPAFLSLDGYHSFYEYGALHRENGPAWSQNAFQGFYHRGNIVNVT